MKYVVFLRGVNVGGRTVKSIELRDCFEKAGFASAQTVLATGNVIIESDEDPEKLKLQIEKFLLAAFSFPIKVCLVSSEKLAEIIKNYPFENNSEFHRYVIFTNSTPEASLKLDDQLEAVQLGAGVIYWQVLKGRTLDSNFAKLAAKQASKNFSTTRNLNTLKKVLAKF